MTESDYFTYGLQPLHLPAHHVGYIVADGDLRVIGFNPIMAEWLAMNKEELQGHPLNFLFPELVGMEDALLAMAAHPHQEPLLIPYTSRVTAGDEWYYFDLQIEPFPLLGGHILVTFTNVTARATQEKMIRQQHNDVALLSTQLRVVNEQLAYLLKHFVPPEEAQKLIDSGQLPRLGGEKRCVATLLFADMRKFTAVAERLQPEQIFDLLNLYLAILAEAAAEEEGVVIQIVGDMIMVAFNVTTDQPDHALRGARAAWGMQARLTAFAQQMEKQRDTAVPPPQFGIGVHTGEVTAGYIGVKGRYRYAVVSDTTNVAYHLCAHALAGQIIISEDTLAHLPAPDPATTPLPFTHHPLGNIAPKSRVRELAIYELRPTHPPFSNGGV